MLRLSLLLSLAAVAIAAPPTVTVPGLGTAVGNVSAAGEEVVQFLGIPYAEAPIGARRQFLVGGRSRP